VSNSFIEIIETFMLFSLPILALIDSMTTTDFVPEITDPHIFDIPAECKNAV
jgi:hypothetical protein